ncbi:MAG: hypothetical protein P8Y44_14640, partial [Acidobacteriota bacterium]
MFRMPYLQQCRSLGLGLTTIAVLLMLSSPSPAQGPPTTATDDLTSEIRTYRETNEAEILQSFVDLLRLPNVATDTENTRRNAEF